MKKIILFLSAIFMMTNAFSMKSYKAFIDEKSCCTLSYPMLNQMQIYESFPFLDYYKITNMLIYSSADKNGNKQLFQAEGIMSLIRRDLKTGYFRYRIEIIPLVVGGVSLPGREKGFSIDAGKLRFDVTNSNEIYIEGYAKRTNNKIEFKTLPTQKLFEMKTIEDKFIRLKPLKNIPITIEVEKEAPYVPPNQSK